MCLEETQSVLELAKGCSSSIIGLDDTMSFTSETTANISAVFDFDTLILGSRIYQHAERSHLREAIRAKKSRKNTSLETAMVANDVEITALFRDEISNRTAEGRTKGEFGDQHGNRESITTYKLATNTLTAESLSNPVLSTGSSRQLDISDPLNLWRKSSRRKVLLPEHMVYQGSSLSEKLSVPKVVILGTSESGKSTLLKALQSCLKQQLYLFDYIVNCRWFEKSSFNIVFTKIDMLEEWLLRSPVEYCIPDYSPGDSSFGLVEHYMEWLEKRFMSLVSSATVLKRTQIIRTNLVDASRRPAQEPWESLDELVRSADLWWTPTTPYHTLHPNSPITPSSTIHS
jgi:hypothetical protein